MAGGHETTFEPGGARFTGAAFGDETKFTDTAFGDNGNFIGATFGDWAMFTRATFGQSNFSGATFGARAMFGGSAFFDGVTFSDNANFSGASFGDEAVFDRSAFGVTPLWRGLPFFSLFTHAAFADGVTFTGAAFGSHANFAGAAFGGPVSSARCLVAVLSSPALPSVAAVLSEGRISKVRWTSPDSPRSNGPGMLQMRMGITGLRKLLHCQSTHLRTISLRNGQARNYDVSMKFDGTFRARRGSFEETANFTGARFYSPPTFEAATKLCRMDFTGAHIGFAPPGDWFPWTEDSQIPVRLRAFRKIVEETKNHDLERDLYIEERKAERGIG